MTLRLRVADLIGLDPSGQGRVTHDSLIDAQGLPKHEALVGHDEQGLAVQLPVDADNVGLIAHLVSLAKRSAALGEPVLLVADAVLQASPTQRVLQACDSYLPSLRSMAPGHVMDVLLAHPDPKVGVFAGGLRDGLGNQRRYPVVNEAGQLELRTALYDGEKIFLYVPEQEVKAIESMRSVLGSDARYDCIEIVSFAPDGLLSREARLEARFDRPGVIWVSTRCDALPELKDNNYLVPGSRFAIEAYYHDARINAPGAMNTIEVLIMQGDPESIRRAEMVLSALRGTTNVFVNQVNTLGKVQTANLTLYAGRSQPPALTTCIRKTYEAWIRLHLGEPEQIEQAQVWLRWATAAAVKEYETVWMADPRHDIKTGLSRFLDEVASQAPEEKVAHYAGMQWDADAIQSDASVREQGWDSHVGAMALEGPFAGRPIQHRMLPVCLNSVLYKVERDLAELHRSIGSPEADVQRFEVAASQRKATMNRLMWNSQLNVYSDLIFDPNDVERDPSSYLKNSYEDLRGLLPMWAGLVEPKSWRADALHQRIKYFKQTGGLATGAKHSWDRAVALNPNYVDRCQWGQWEVGWPIATYETIEGLRACGFSDTADELAYRWCWAVQSEMERQGGLQLSERGEFEGPVTEKIDVVAVSLWAAAERYGYGNQGRGTDGNSAGFRWGYDAFKLLARSLPEELAKSLASGTHPDDLLIGG